MKLWYLELFAKKFNFGIYFTVNRQLWHHCDVIHRMFVLFDMYGKRRPIYHTTNTIFGKDQRMPATGYISYPILSASLTHCIRQWVHIFMLMYAYHRAFCPSRADTLMYFPRNSGGSEQVVLLVLCLLSARFVGSKSSHFAVQKMVRLFKSIYNDLVVW